MEKYDEEWQREYDHFWGHVDSLNGLIHEFDELLNRSDEENPFGGGLVEGGVIESEEYKAYKCALEYRTRLYRLGTAMSFSEPRYAHRRGSRSNPWIAMAENVRVAARTMNRFTVDWGDGRLINHRMNEGVATYYVEEEDVATAAYPFR